MPAVLAAGTWTALLIGTAFLAVFVRRVTDETFSMSRALAATQMALAREQQLSALGGVVAAAAHELGTPLATIKLVSTELVEELAGQPELQEDARSSAPRPTAAPRSCAPWAARSDDTLVRYAPFASVVEEAAAPHAERGVRVVVRVEGAPLDDGPEPQPLVSRSPEIIQGLRNLVQNAVDFARTHGLDRPRLDRQPRCGRSSATTVRAIPQDLIGRIGDPFVRGRGAAPEERPGYEGMGLGLFIAKTLLERSGARLEFDNGDEEPAGHGRPTSPARPAPSSPSSGRGDASRRNATRGRATARSDDEDGAGPAAARARRSDR